MANITASPYWYNGTDTSRQNLATNVSIVVSSRVGGYSQLYSILNTPAVAANISGNPSITQSELCLHGTAAGWLGTRQGWMTADVRFNRA